MVVRAVNVRLPPGIRPALNTILSRFGCGIDRAFGETFEQYRFDLDQAGMDVPVANAFSPGKPLFGGLDRPLRGVGPADHDRALTTPEKPIISRYLVEEADAITRHSTGSLLRWRSLRPGPALDLDPGQKWRRAVFCGGQAQRGGSRSGCRATPLLVLDRRRAAEPSPSRGAGRRLSRYADRH
jgi:hypothetical protein